MFIGNGFGIGVTKLSKQNMGQWHAYTKRDGRGIGVHIYKLLYSITRYDRVYMVFWLYLLVQSTVQWLEKVNQWCRDHGSREIRHSPKSVNGTKWERERERERNMESLMQRRCWPQPPKQQANPIIASHAAQHPSCCRTYSMQKFPTHLAFPLIFNPTPPPNYICSSCI